ncbi:MAG: ribulokinase [Anaerolineae bacterium]|jgi:L-ribulokinase|nr:ribulokinase [Chloroflexota bacterium]
MANKYAIGIDFGTESARAVLVRLSDGAELASAVSPYADGVIDETLPGSGIRLEPDWALQNPMDYVTAVKETVPKVLAASGVSANDVIGIGIDFTACTMLPTKADGTPLCVLPAYRDNPHAWVKLWKHHAAQPEANKLNRLAEERGETWLARYGGKISSEWFFPKALQILDEAPEIYDAADRLIEAADWVVWQLTGVETRNSCTAGYKAIWSKEEGFPSPDFFAALHPRMRNIVQEKMQEDIKPLGARAGGLTAEMAAATGLLPGTAVAVANVDAHVAVPAATVTSTGRMVMIMGTSICHMVVGQQPRIVPGMCGVVEDGILPNLAGFEAGQSAVGDIFAWFVDHCVPAEYQQEAAERGLNLHQLLEEKASTLQVGESGLLALDWWNGNRSVLVDVDLTGLLLGATLATRAEEIYRALIEATAFGTRMIIEAFRSNGVPVDDLVAAGGLPERNRLFMQIYADVTGQEIKVVASTQAGALGSAMHGAVAAGAAAGGFDSIEEAAAQMAHLRDDTFKPNAENHAVYNELYQEYVRLHDYFGRGENDVMKRLKAIRARALSA